MLEATASLGLILGPIVGSSIYTLLGFKGAFVTLGVALIPLAIIMNCIFIKVRNDSVEEEQLLEPLLDGNRAKSAMPPTMRNLSDSESICYPLSVIKLTCCDECLELSVTAPFNF